MSDYETAVLAVLESLRPMLRADGGDIELVLADEAAGRIEVRLKGACSSCIASMTTMAMGVEARLKQEIPSIREVVSV